MGLSRLEHGSTEELARQIGGCHRGAALNCEKRGYINHRRYSKQDALKLKQILEIRKPLEKVN